jgi:23S rRNA pseudouridine1911/1915/1917 synthase
MPLFFPSQFASQRRSLLIGLLFLMTLLCYNLTTSYTIHRPLSCRKHSTTSLFAKPPPSSLFNLDAIEAFEAHIDRQDLEKLTGRKATDDDDDLVDWDDEEEESIISVVITEHLNGKRIDLAISDLLTDFSRSFCGSLVTDKRVTLVFDNGEKEVLDRKSFKVQIGQVLEITIPRDECNNEIIPQDIPLEILFEDEHMIVVNKAAHMVIHPAAGNWDGTVVNALSYYLSKKSSYGRGDFIDSQGKVVVAEDLTVTDGTNGEAVTYRPGIVHRLDKGTTGVLVVAKTKVALAALSHEFASRNVEKTYLAVTVGNPGQEVTIDKPIGRHPLHRQRMRVVPDPHRRDSALAGSVSTGRRAISHVETLAFDGSLSLVKVRIETGRTHQIRVHLKDRQTPIYGDDVYGIKDWNQRLMKQHRIERPLLHAYKLVITHPTSGERLTFCAPLPEDMSTIAKAIYPAGPLEWPELFNSDDSSNEKIYR